jgi:hypothetical protein
LEQFEDNLAALYLALSSRHVDELDKLTAPRLNLPFHFIDMNASAFGNSGTFINRVEARLIPWLRKTRRTAFSFEVGKCYSRTPWS